MATYLSSADAAELVTIPIAAGALAAYLTTALELIDARINARCNLASNTTNAADLLTLQSVEYNAFLKVMQNTRLSREGVPAEVKFNDIFFSAEDILIMNDIRLKTKRSLWYEDSG
jgi:hypothetical protein